MPPNALTNRELLEDAELVLNHLVDLDQVNDPKDNSPHGRAIQAAGRLLAAMRSPTPEDAFTAEQRGLLDRLLAEDKAKQPAKPTPPTGDELDALLIKLRDKWFAIEQCLERFGEFEKSQRVHACNQIIEQALKQFGCELTSVTEAHETGATPKPVVQIKVK